VLSFPRSFIVTSPPGPAISSPLAHRQMREQPLTIVAAGHMGRDCRCCVHSCMCVCIQSWLPVCLSGCLCVLWIGILTLMCCVLSGMADWMHECMDGCMDGRSTTPPTFSHSLAPSLAFNACTVPYGYAFMCPCVCAYAGDRSGYVSIYPCLLLRTDGRTDGRNSIELSSTQVLLRGKEWHVMS